MFLTQNFNAHFYRGGVNFSEENPRVSGTLMASASNVTWVGSITTEFYIDLKLSDKVVEIENNGDYAFSAYIDGEQTEAGIPKGAKVQFPLNLNNNFRIYAYNYTSQTPKNAISYKIW